jgi:ubiquitin C-terminal hydrolase
MTDRVGLVNLGNTCFLNAVLQALRYSPPIAEIFLKHVDRDVTLREESDRKGIVTAFQTLMRDFWTISAPAGRTPSLVPRGFLFHLHTVLRDTEDDWYRPGQQCDAAEAITYILNSLHDGMYRRVKMDVAGEASSTEEASHIKAIQSWASFFSREFSPIVTHFNGQTQITVTCTECGNISERYEPWLMLKAPIPGAETAGGPAPTLEACLDHCFAAETIEGYACDGCKKRTTAKKQERLSHLPPVVILSIKRFTNAGHKIRGKIPWDVDALDLSPWTAFARDPFTDSRERPVYETFAVIEHHGFTHGGHYRMFAREGGATWLEYDDSSVREVPPDAVVTADSYVAFLMPRLHAGAMRGTLAAHVGAARSTKGFMTAEE